MPVPRGVRAPTIPAPLVVATAALLGITGCSSVVTPALPSATSPQATAATIAQPTGNPSPPPMASPSARASLPDTSPAIERFMADGVVVHGPRDVPAIALTFDGDMTPAMLQRLTSGRVASWYDARIVAQLRAADAHATVFLTGLWARTYPDVVADLAADPAFELENHSFDHAAWESPCYGLPTVNGTSAKRDEVIRAVEAMTAAGAATPSFFRFPGGCHGPGDVTLVRSLGETPVQWDVVSGDAFQSDPTIVERAVLRRVGPGSIVVFHLIGGPNAPATADALAVILPELARRGFALVTLRELLGLAPG